MAVLAVLASLAACTYPSGSNLIVEPDRGAAPIQPQLFGMTIHRAYNGDSGWPTEPTTAVRLWDTNTNWRDIQPTRNTWNWATLDAHVERARRHGARILLTLGITPQWASARPNEHSDFGPGGAAEPRDLRDYARYVRAVAARYRGKIAAYEVWNEPMVPNYYTGTPAKMGSITHVAYDAIKLEDRSAAVVSPGPFPNSIAARWLDDYLKTGAAKFFDVAGIHIYKSTPEALMPAFESLRKVFERHGVKKPVWDTETGYKASWNIPTSQWRGYVARTYVLAAAGGVSRLYWYAWDNVTWVGLRMLASDRVTPTPAGRAFGETYDWLVGATISKCTGAQNGNGTWQCSIKHGTRAGVIAWHPTATVGFTAPARTVSMRYLDGRTVPVHAGQRVSIGVEPVEFVLG